MSISRPLKYAALLLLTGSLFLAGCVSASKMLDRAESAWASGQYVQAINYALSSYEKAVDRNKEPAEISAAKGFLQERFPSANDYLLESAESQLNGSDTQKAEAWKTFQSLVEMNRRVRDSIASSFLTTEDYRDQLQKAKEVAAQIKYVKALELMGEDRRTSYISAYSILKEIDVFVPDYRDIRLLSEQCRELATLTVAFSDRALSYTVKDGDIESYPGLPSDSYGVIRGFVESNDHPDFLKFVTAGSIKGAQDAGAVLFVEIQGDVWVSADTEDDYFNNGTIVWERSYGGTPTLLVTRISDSKTEVAVASLDLDQEISIEFFPQKYTTVSLTPDMYNKQFNNAGWMNSQLSDANSAIRKADGSADMVVWAEMQYGGTASFLTTAEVTGTEGTQALPIDPAVYGSTATFINQTLPAYLQFTDMDLPARIVDEMTSAFLSTSGVRELLSNLED